MVVLVVLTVLLVDVTVEVVVEVLVVARYICIVGLIIWSAKEANL